MTRTRSMSSRAGRRLGFTLVELLAATMLSTMLMVAVLGVLSGLTAQRRALLAQNGTEPWMQRLIEQLRRDLVNGRRIALHENEVTITGFGGRDFHTDAASHRPTKIVYEHVFTDHRSWLVRHEFHLDSLSNQNVVSDLVCTGVTRINIRPEDDEESRRRNRGSSRSMAVPDRVRIELFGIEEDQILFQQVLQIR